MVNGSTLALSDDGNDASVIEDAIVDVETGDVAALLNSSTEVIVMPQDPSMLTVVCLTFISDLWIADDENVFKTRAPNKIYSFGFVILLLFVFWFSRVDNNI